MIWRIIHGHSINSGYVTSYMPKVNTFSSFSAKYAWAIPITIALANITECLDHMRTVSLIMYRVHSGGVFVWGSPVLYLYSRHAVYQMKPWGKKVKPSVKTQTEGDHLQWATWFYSRQFDKQHTRMKRWINGGLLVPWRQFPETDTTFHMQREQSL